MTLDVVLVCEIEGVGKEIREEGGDVCRVVPALISSGFKVGV